MVSTLRNAWKTPELKKKILYTMFFIAVYRFGIHIPTTGINTEVLSNLTGSNNLLGFYDLLSGGAFKTFSIFALGVIPYINASIIMQLLTIAIPSLEQLSKEGEEGRKKIQKYTRYAAVILALIQSYGSYVLLYNARALKETGVPTALLIMITVTTASVFLMWLGDQITIKGIGNGVSLLIFINIATSLPQTAKQLSVLLKAETINIVEVILFIIAIAIIILAIIYMTLAERRISVQYAGKTVGNKTFKGQSTHIPINLTASGVIAIIFAMSVMEFPRTIGQFLSGTSWYNTYLINGKYSPFNSDKIIYPIVYAILVVFFSWFYTQITFKPDEMAENMHKSSGFIPGIRPGQPTANYIERILSKVSLIGGAFAALVAIFPLLLRIFSEFGNLPFAGTSMLILVSFALETGRQLESQLVMRHYQGFLK